MIRVDESCILKLIRIDESHFCLIFSQYESAQISSGIVIKNGLALGVTLFMIYHFRYAKYSV